MCAIHPFFRSGSQHTMQIQLSWKVYEWNKKNKYSASSVQCYFKIGKCGLKGHKRKCNMSDERCNCHALLICYFVHWHCMFWHFFRFLQHFVGNISKTLNSRLQLNEKSEEEQNALTEKHQNEIGALNQRCKEVCFFLYFLYHNSFEYLLIN